FRDEAFLFNYGALLHKAGAYKKSIELFKKCTMYIDNSQTQTYIADNYINLEEYELAENYAQNARYMRPSTFLPLYHLVIIWHKLGRHEEAEELAVHIIEKPVKIHNATSHLIKFKMKQYVETGEFEL